MTPRSPGSLHKSTLAFRGLGTAFLAIGTAIVVEVVGAEGEPVGSGPGCLVIGIAYASPA